MKRIALFSDVHGNVPALEAVLADIQAASPDETYCLGDLIGYGPDSAGVIALMRESGIPTIQGNYDEGVASRRGSCGCYYRTDEAKEDGNKSYEFTDQALSDADASWLLSLPGQIPLEHEGAQILLVHGSPRKINEYLLLDRDGEQLVRLADQAGADAVFHGHIHIPYHRAFAVGGWTEGGRTQVDRTVHYASSGSVGKPKDGDPRACWIEALPGAEADVCSTAAEDDACQRLGVTDTWLGAKAHRVEYDIDSVASAMLASGLPERLAQALRDA